MPMHIAPLQYFSAFFVLSILMVGKLHNC